MKKLLLLPVLLIVFSCSNKASEKVEMTTVDEGITPDSVIETPVTIIDTVKAKSLEKYFRVTKDEYSASDDGFYIPKSAPKFTNSNALYLYFATYNGEAIALHLKFQYYAEDWLFIEKVKFLIDGKPFEIIPKEVDRDSGDGGYIWESFDNTLFISDQEFITALSTAKSAKMKIEGQQYYKEKIITKQQIASIKTTLEMYYALGGTKFNL